MIHLVFFLVAGLDPVALACTVLGCLAGTTCVTAVLRRLPEHGPRRILYGAAVAVCLSILVWCVFLGGLAAGFPRLGVGLPLRAALSSYAPALLATLAGEGIRLRSRRSVRTAMLVGSVFACGMSLSVFSAMAALVRPFALAYDLKSVLVVIGLGATLAAFAVWEAGDTGRRHRLLPAASLLALSMLTLSLGSLGSILPFDQWINATKAPNDLASWPILVVLGAGSTVGLVLVLSGSLLDGWAAARDRREIEHMRQLADSGFEGLLIHRHGHILDANARLGEMTGYPVAELRQLPLASLLSASALAGLLSAIDGSPNEIEFPALDGTRLPVEALSRVIPYAGGEAVVTALRDIRERRAAEARISYLAHHDALTGLPNRRHLEQSLEQAVRLSRRGTTRLALCCLDLDGFKAVNDTLGHAAGDLLLRQVATRMRKVCRDGDLVARIGGDEFVVVLQNDIDTDSVSRLATRLVQSLSQPFDLDGQSALIGTSIGLSFHPDDADGAAGLLKCADLALYRAKAQGRGQVCLFEAGMDRLVQERRELEIELRAALAGDSLSLAYQPLFDGKGGLIGFEALCRWSHPQRGQIPPDRFIPLAEQSGLILPLGEWVLRSACRAASDWPGGYRIAVNLSPAQVMRARLPELVARILDETGLAAARLELEVTEGVLIEDAPQALTVLTALRDLGVRVVLDDFGTGYSSLGYLHSFPFDKVKIDRSFISRIGEDGRVRTIVDAIIAMSHKLRLDVTAEGIETETQLSILSEHGCDEMQGYLLGRPMGATQLDAFLRGKLVRPAYPTISVARAKSTDKTLLTPLSCIVTP